MRIRTLNALWVLRGLWLLVAIAAPWDLLAWHSSPVNVVLQTVGWSIWAIGAVSVFAVLPAGLTAIRLVTPIIFAGSLVALPHALAHDKSLLLSFVAILSTTLCEIALLLPSISTAMVQGGAYGNENRIALRTPVPYIAPAFVAWAITAASSIGAPLLLASKQWILGGGVCAIALGLLYVVPSRMHRLSRRWLVIVPSGIVIHDHLVLAETMMLKSSNILYVTLSDAPSGEADLTGGVFGSRLVINLHESEKVVISAMTMKLLHSSEALHVQSFAIAPSNTTHARQQILNRVSPLTNE
ncbi:MAG: hypothetical protein EXQ63_02585 [Ilumatobacteraceae bacterium]|nr:hypothetical protein [Ilumatobacteraceae bacterium]